MKRTKSIIFISLLFEQIKLKLTHLKDYSSECSKFVLINSLPFDLIHYLCLVTIDVYYDFYMDYLNLSLSQTNLLHDQLLIILQNIEKKLIKQKKYKLFIKPIDFTKYNLYSYHQKLLDGKDERMFRWFFFTMNEIINNKKNYASPKLLQVVGVHIVIKTLLILLLLIHKQYVLNPIFMRDSKTFGYPMIKVNTRIWWQNFNQFLLFKLYSLYPIYTIKKNTLITNYVFLPYFDTYFLTLNSLTFM